MPSNHERFPPSPSHTLALPRPRLASPGLACSSPGPRPASPGPRPAWFQAILPSKRAKEKIYYLFVPYLVGQLFETSPTQHLLKQGGVPCNFVFPLLSYAGSGLRQSPPRDPAVLKILRSVNFGTGRKFGTDAAKRYGEGSEMLVPKGVLKLLWRSIL